MHSTLFRVHHDALMVPVQVSQQPPEERVGAPKMAPVWKNALAWGSFMSVFANVRPVRGHLLGSGVQFWTLARYRMPPTSLAARPLLASIRCRVLWRCGARCCALAGHSAPAHRLSRACAWEGVGCPGLQFSAQRVVHRGSHPAATLLAWPPGLYSAPCSFTGLRLTSVLPPVETPCTAVCCAGALPGCQRSGGSCPGENHVCLAVLRWACCGWLDPSPASGTPVMWLACGVQACRLQARPEQPA